ncbi:MAG: alpha-amylase [Lutibacter sp.]|nr:MAG: alpha-amylase [Lutibacter sp.]
MKKLVHLLFFLIPLVTFSQVSTSPALPTANEVITIIFDATGTGLDGYTGDVYAHTGATVNDETWQNVIGDWGNNSTQPQLTRDSSNLNLYTLLITPDIFTFYNVNTSNTVTQLSFVFRASSGSPQTADIFISIYQAGLNITFTNPENNSVFNLNDNITISAESSINADLELFVNEVSELTATNTTSISTSYTFNTTGNHTLKVIATTGGEAKETSISAYVKTATQTIVQPSGLNYGLNKNSDNSVTFLLKAPEKTDIIILGDFNNWTIDANYQMAKDGDDFWITLSDLDVNTEFAYQYLIDYDIKVADPYSEKILDPWNDQWIKDGNYPNLKEYPTNLTAGFVSTFLINEPTYTWNVTDFIKPAQDNLIIYELHIRDFTESDSYNEALTYLDYLEKLGVNAIELMPINEFEGADSWGYNPALYMALDKAYGTKNDFKKFVDACHQRGIAVLADVVFNHSYGQSPLLQMYWDSATNKPSANNPWYNQDHNFVDNTSAHWGYDFNHESAYTTAFFNDVLSYWMTEYKIDGFRFDFTKGFSNTQWVGSNNWASDYDSSRIAILKNYADHVWNHNPTNKPYVIFEHLSENSEETELANYGVMLWGNMNHNYNQNTMGWSSDTDVSWISYKQRGWNNPNIVGYMESHDEERIMYKNIEFGNSNENYNVKDLNTALSRQELAAMFFFTIPGPKMIWQFGELGYDISIDENGRVGRKPIHWEYVDDVNRKQIYNTWATLIEFKRQQPVFNSDDFTLNVGTLTKSIVLRDDSMDVVAIGNFDITSKPIIPQFTQTGIWYEYFTGEEKNITNTSESIILNPGEYKLYSTVKLLDPRGGTFNDDSDNDGVVDTEDLCPNTPLGNVVNDEGCRIFTLPANNFNIQVIGETCPEKNNGQLSITANETQNYVVTIDEVAYTFSSSLLVDGLAPDTYIFCIGVEGETYEQCYRVVVESGTEVGGKVSLESNKASIEIENGTAPFSVYVNKEELFKTSSPVFTLDVKHGDLVEVKTAVSCEGIYSKAIILLESIIAYPNPSNGIFEISVPVSQQEILIELYTVDSQLISRETYSVQYGKVQIDIEDHPKGLYIAKVHLDQPVTLKIIKQ